MTTKSVLFAATASIAVSLFATATRPSVTRNVPTQSEVANRTTALRIVSTLGESLNGQTVLKVTIQNVSDKSVVEYTFVRSDGSSLSTSGATTGWELLPQDQDVMRISLSPGTSEPVVLVALLFDDGTGQGDFDETAYMRNYRAGVEAQYQRALPFLHRHLENYKPVNARELLQKELLPGLSSLPDSPEGHSEKGVSAGMRAAKQFILGQLVPSRKKLATTGDLDSDSLKSDLDRATAVAERALAKIGKQNTHIKG